MGDLRASVAKAIIRSRLCELIDWLPPSMEVGDYGVSVVLSSMFFFCFFPTHTCTTGAVSLPGRQCLPAR